jgi:hypothetical protein
MPRYLVERTFPDGLHIPIDGEGAAACLSVVGRNAGEGVTWIHSCRPLVGSLLALLSGSAGAEPSRLASQRFIQGEGGPDNA